MHTAAHETVAKTKLTSIEGGAQGHSISVAARRRQLQAQSLRRLSEHVPEVAALAVRRRACELDLEAFAIGVTYGDCEPISA